MAFCSNCGSDVQGKFCAKCGTPLAATDTPMGAGTPPSPQTPPPQSPPQSGFAPQPPPPGQGYAQAPQAAGLEENVASALCYLFGWITGVLFLVLAPYNQNRLIRFHAFQAIFMSIGMIAVFIALFMVSAILAFVPYVGPVLGLLIYAGVWLGVLVLWVMLMYKAYNRERLVLPIVGPLAEKQA